jgi:lysophospholipase L1-like esterase
MKPLVSRHPFLRTFCCSLVLLLSLCFTGVQAYAQAPFQSEIDSFKKQDLINPVPAGAILFVGSSSFRKWTDVQAAFPGYPIINRGFGGSTFPDVIRYAGDIILPYKPKQIVIYCGDNDLAFSDTVTAQAVYERFLQLYRVIRSDREGVDILYVSIKPSPSRVNLMPRMEEANRLIGNFLRGQAHAAFADVYHRMLDSSGHPIEDLFLDDKLHMNAKGYVIWQKVIAPYLVK